MKRHHDDRPASSFCVDLERCGEHMSDERRTNPESGMAMVDSEAA